MPIIAIYFFDVLIEFLKIIKNEFLHFKIWLIVDTKLNFLSIEDTAFAEICTYTYTLH